MVDDGCVVQRNAPPAVAVAALLSTGLNSGRGLPLKTAVDADTGRGDGSGTKDAPQGVIVATPVTQHKNDAGFHGEPSAATASSTGGDVTCALAPVEPGHKRHGNGYEQATPPSSDQTTDPATLLLALGVARVTCVGVASSPGESVSDSLATVEPGLQTDGSGNLQATPQYSKQTTEPPEHCHCRQFRFRARRGRDHKTCSPLRMTPRPHMRHR